MPSTWSNMMSQGGCVLCVDEQHVRLFTVYGQSANQEVSRIAQQIAAGEDPGIIESDEVAAIPTCILDHIKIREGGTMVEFFQRDQEGKLDSMWFIPNNLQDREEIAREAARITERKFEESHCDASLFSAVWPPAFVTLILSLLTGAILLLARDAAAGKEVAHQANRQGLKQVALWIAALLGVRGAVILAALTLIPCLIWIMKSAIKRPQVLILSFTPLKI
jgi:hypothetical protein